MNQKRRKKEQKNRHGFFKVLRNNVFMLFYIFKYTPGLLVATFIYMFLTAVRAVLNNVYALKYLLDAFQLKKGIYEVGAFIFFFIGINLLDSVLGTFYQNVILPKKKLVLAQKMQNELFVKAKEIELAGYDDPKFYNDFIWSMEQADQQALNVLNNFGEFIGTVVRIGGVGAIIWSSDLLGIYVVALSLIISFVAQLKINQLDYELSVQQKPIQRERDYTSRVLYLSDYAKEVRLSHVSGVLIENFSRVNEKLISVIKSFGRRNMVWSFLGDQISGPLLMDGFYMVYLCYQTLVREVFTYGTFMGLYNGVFNLRNNLQVMGRVLSRFQKDSLYIEHLRKFIRYVPRIADCEKPWDMPTEPAVVELRDVSFCYEGNEEPTLQNLNLTIHPGEKIALVGYNGAGKSTLIKLLMRLYDVSSGEILLNGRNIKDYRVQDYRNYFGVVFQDFQLFAGTIAENVKMDESRKSDEQAVKEALEQSGFSEKLAELPEGIATMITREFSSQGINLSGGEAQKVAIARIFPRNCHMVILDEPSSALDPISEYKVNQSMLNAAGEKTVVFISHRLSTTRIADRILMLEHGKIIEQGSHEELMELDGKYAKMFRMQAEKYQAAG